MARVLHHKHGSRTVPHSENQANVASRKPISGTCVAAKKTAVTNHAPQQHVKRGSVLDTLLSYDA